MVFVHNSIDMSVQWIVYNESSFSPLDLIIVHSISNVILDLV